MFKIKSLQNCIKNLSDRINVLFTILNCIDKEGISNSRKKNDAKLKEKTNYWKKIKQINSLNREYFPPENSFSNLNKLKRKIKDTSNLLDLIIENDDKEIYDEIVNELNNLEKKIKKIELTCMFSKKYDNSDCYLDIQSGSGGIEAQDWSRILMRMYLRWSGEKGFKTEIINQSEGEVTGIKSVTIKISGRYAYGWLRTETGVHRLVRKSPFNSRNRRHTSFSSTFVYPAIEDKIDIKINLSDLRIDVYRASGAGGQHVNRTESAVRVIHIPTGLITQCQSDRSQHKNKNQAIKQMKAKLYRLEIQRKNSEKKKEEEKKSNIGWGSQIRSYILDDSRIKDLRTGIEIRNVQTVLDGKIDKFIKASLKAGL